MNCTISVAYHCLCSPLVENPCYRTLHYIIYIISSSHLQRYKELLLDVRCLSSPAPSYHLSVILKTAKLLKLHRVMGIKPKPFDSSYEDNQFTISNVQAVTIFSMEKNVTFCRGGHEKSSSSAIWVLLGFVNTVCLETMTWIRSATHPGLLVPVADSSLQSVRWARCRMLQMEDTGPWCWLITLLSLSCICLLLRWEMSTHEAKHWQWLEEEVNGTRGMNYYPVVHLWD